MVESVGSVRGAPTAGLITSRFQRRELVTQPSQVGRDPVWVYTPRTSGSTPEPAIFRHSLREASHIASFKYKAEKQPDGNFTIRDIDIFKACSRANPLTGEMQDFGKEFCEGAVQKFAERENKDGYRPPVHIGHHSETGDEKKLAGFLSNLRLTNGNDGVPTVISDIVDIPPDVFSEIYSKRLPYRSVEIKNPKVQEFSSLALMSSVVPYHKLALTQVEFSDSPVSAQFWAGRAPAKFWNKKTHKRVCFAEPIDIGGVGLRFWDQFEFGRRQQMQGRGGQQQPMDGGDQDDDSMLDGLPPEVIQQLMAQMQGGGQQQPDMGGQQGGDQQIHPDDQAALTEMGAGANEMSQVLAALQAMPSQITQGVTQAVAQLMAGNQQNRPVAPAPVGNAEPKQPEAVEFKEVAPVMAAPTAAQFNELATKFNKLGEQFAAQGATLADMKKVLDAVAPWVFAQQESDDVAAVFAEVNRTGVVKAEQEKLRKSGYGDSQIQLATKTVTSRITPAVLHSIRETSMQFSEAGTQLSQHVPQLFADVVAEWKAANVVPAGIAQTNQSRPAPVQANGVAPTTFAQPEDAAKPIVPKTVTAAQIEELKRRAPGHAHQFAENNGKAEAVKSLGVFFAEFEAGTPEQKQMFRNDPIEYAIWNMNQAVQF